MKFLCGANAEKLVRVSEKLLIRSFHRASSLVPAYKQFLASQKVNATSVKDITTFKKNVPLLSKEDYFLPFGPEAWFYKGRFEKMKSIMTSSGFSGTFAYGAELQNNRKKTRQSIDFFLDMLFNTSRKKTLLINCVPMGVHIETSLPLVETSVRSDMALAVVKKISPQFEQTILVGDPHFIKKLVEEGVEQQVDWARLNTSLILGQDYFSEAFRQYLAHLIGLDLYNNRERLVMATMGTTELGLNIFHESFETIKLRGIIQKNSHFRNVLPQFETQAVPYIFHYYPFRHYIEEVEEKNYKTSLAFSTINRDSAIPLFRYKTGDAGKVIMFDNLKNNLLDAGLDDCVPQLKLPLAMIEGRLNSHLEWQGQTYDAADIKQALYENHSLASKTTGYFRLVHDHERPEIKIQLKEGLSPDTKLVAEFTSTLLGYLPAEIPVTVYKYQEFPFNMTLNYESKFINL